MTRSTLYIVIAVIVAVASIAAGVKEVQSSEAASKASGAASSETNRCLDVPRQLRRSIAGGLNPGVRLGVMQAVKSNETWTSDNGYWVDVPVYWVGAALGGPKGRNKLATWSVFKSLGPDSGLLWAGDGHARQTSTWGSFVPLKMRRSLPNDGWNESMDCVEAAEAAGL